ncbi:MAG: twin-arginine translocation signal domain-containing protein [Cyanobacteria bacterium]|nr:twin-arginine translocation signal domain-containing protein [Cyanobacteriota bacterium]MDA1020742.1 twin-arginine translocation signal domain-containing protein [Cyanobacteriota bacterium]
METKTKQISRRAFLAGLGVTGAALGLSACCPMGSLDHKTKAIDLVHGNDPSLFPVYDGKEYTKKDFSRLTQDTNLGLSPEMINNHLGLYAKYVDKVNQSEAEMRAGEITELGMKNLAFSLNGMALHDIYFSNMNSSKSKASKALSKAINESYGSFDSYYRNLTNIATQVKGWSITAVNLLNGKLINYGTEDHSANFPNFVMPILALDVYEHAYVIDFGDDGKNSYLDSFTAIIDWDLVSRRYDAMMLQYS